MPFLPTRPLSLLYPWPLLRLFIFYFFFSYFLSISFLLLFSLFLLQSVDGVDYAEYLASQTSYDTVFVATIAAAAGVPIDSVQSLQLVPSSGCTSSRKLAERRLRRPDRNLRAGARYSAICTVTLQYTVAVPASSGTTYDEMSSQLAQSVDTGEFTDMLHQFAAADGVPALTTASSNSVETQDTSDPIDTNGNSSSSKSSETMSYPVIAFGGFAALAIVVYFGMKMCIMSSADTSGNESQEVLEKRGRNKIYTLCVCYKI